MDQLPNLFHTTQPLFQMPNASCPSSNSTSRLIINDEEMTTSQSGSVTCAAAIRENATLPHLNIVSLKTSLLSSPVLSRPLHPKRAYDPSMPSDYPTNMRTLPAYSVRYDSSQMMTGEIEAREVWRGNNEKDGDQQKNGRMVIWAQSSS